MAKAIMSQFGLKLEMQQVPVRDLLRSTCDILEEGDTDEAGGANRQAKAARLNKLGRSLRSSEAAMMRGEEIFMDPFHVSVRPVKHISEGDFVDVQQLLADPSVQIAREDCNGRLTVLTLLARENPAWLDMKVWVQLYLDPERLMRIRLMEILNNQRASLAADFRITLESEFYKLASESEIENRHFVSFGTMENYSDRNLPFRKIVKLHRTRHQKDMISITLLHTATRDMLAKLKPKKGQTGMPADEQLRVLNLTWRFIAGASDDIIFGENWGQWAKGAGLMLNVLSAAVAPLVTKELLRAPLSNDKAILMNLVSQYGQRFRLYLQTHELPAQKKFTDCTGAKNVTGAIRAASKLIAG